MHAVVTGGGKYNYFHLKSRSTLIGVSFAMLIRIVCDNDRNFLRCKGSVMLRTRNAQPSLWESVLPEVCLRLPVELARIDEWLDDERFFAPFGAHSDPRLGRPSVPMEPTYG